MSHEQYITMLTTSKLLSTIITKRRYNQCDEIHKEVQPSIQQLDVLFSTFDLIVVFFLVFLTLTFHYLATRAIRPNSRFLLKGKRKRGGGGEKRKNPLN